MYLEHILNDLEAHTRITHTTLKFYQSKLLTVGIVVIKYYENIIHFNHVV